MRRVTGWTLGLGLLAGVACAPRETPRLVVVVVVDQMRADILDRFGPAFDGGFRRLLDEGVRFDEAHHAHSMTGTAPGHATLSTGADPRVHGIFEGEWYNPADSTMTNCTRDPSCQVVGSDLPGQSPHRLLVSTVGDWLKETNPASRVYSVALKARASILLGGHDADAAFWLSEEEPRFVTSDHYLDREPAWLTEFNRRDRIFQFLGVSWDLMRPDLVTLDTREDDFATEADGRRVSFPHDFHADPNSVDRDYDWQLRFSPFGDALTWQFAHRLVEEEGLGRDEDVDLLLVGCSSADFVGHLYGPWSQEVQDYYFRLDAFLGEGFRWLDENVGRDRYAVLLTSDHGVAMLPAEAQRRGWNAGRVVHDQFDADLARAVAEASAELGLPRSMERLVTHEGVHLDRALLAASGLAPEVWEAALRRHLGRIPYVERIFPTSELRPEPDGEDPLRDAFRRSWTPGRAPDVMLHYRPNWVVDTYPGGTDHSTAHRYDTHVPLLLLGPGLSPTRIAERVETVDVAPTLADWVGATPAPTNRGTSLLTRLPR